MNIGYRVLFVLPALFISPGCSEDIPLTSPTWLCVEQGGAGEVEISWVEVIDADSYELYFGTEPGEPPLGGEWYLVTVTPPQGDGGEGEEGGGVITGDSATGPPVVLGGLDEGVTYYFALATSKGDVLSRPSTTLAWRWSPRDCCLPSRDACSGETCGSGALCVDINCPRGTSYIEGCGICITCPGGCIYDEEGSNCKHPCPDRECCPPQRGCPEGERCVEGSCEEK